MRRRHIEKFHSNKATGDFDYDDSKTFDENMAIYRSLLPEYDKKTFDNKRQSKYWLTFTVCVLYGAIAIIILLLGNFTNWGNSLLFNELYMFTVTFIIGTIFVIIYLTYKVYTFDFPTLEKEMGYDSAYCPDYWNSSFTFTNTENGTDHDELDADGKRKNYFGDKYNKSQFNMKCHIKPNSGVYTSTDLFNELKSERNYKKPTGNTYPHDSKLIVELEDKSVPNFINNTGLNTETNEYNEFRKVAAKMSGYTYNIHGGGNEELLKNNSFALRDPNGNYYDSPRKIPLKCDTVYPLYLAKKDFDYAKTNKINNYNKFRCAYSKTCGIPWTEAGCY
jgi:hypothetical protein